MKGRNLIFTALLIIASGVALLIAHRSIMSAGVVTTGGILFICAGLLNVLVFDIGKRNDKEHNRVSTHGPVSATMSWLSSAAAIILGICMLLFKPTFIPLVPIMFGILIAFAAFYQLYLLAVGIRPLVLSAWLYIAPLLLAVGAAYLFCQKSNSFSDQYIMLVTAVSLLVFGAATLFEGIALGSHNSSLLKKDTKATEAQKPHEAVEKPKTDTVKAENE